MTTAGYFELRWSLGQYGRRDAGRASAWAFTWPARGQAQCAGIKLLLGDRNIEAAAERVRKALAEALGLSTPLPLGSESPQPCEVVMNKVLVVLWFSFSLPAPQTTPHLWLSSKTR